MALSVGCVLVADDVGRAVVLGFEEAVAGVRGRPGGYSGRMDMYGKLPVWKPW